MINKHFKPYQSKPITRHAYQIKPDDKIAKMDEATYNIVLPDCVVAFKAYERPQPGDYIVYLTGDDIYHCNETVFEERNVV